MSLLNSYSKSHLLSKTLLLFTFYLRIVINLGFFLYKQLNMHDLGGWWRDPFKSLPRSSDSQSMEIVIVFCLAVTKSFKQVFAYYHNLNSNIACFTFKSLSFLFSQGRNGRHIGLKVRRPGI